MRSILDSMTYTLGLTNRTNLYTVAVDSDKGLIDTYLLLIY